MLTGQICKLIQPVFNNYLFALLPSIKHQEMVEVQDFLQPIRTSTEKKNIFIATLKTKKCMIELQFTQFKH